MKKQLFLLVSLPVLCFCQTTTIKNDLQKEKLLGNVKRVRQECYVAKEKFGEIIQSNRKNSLKDNYLKLYNEKGNKTVKGCVK